MPFAYHHAPYQAPRAVPVAYPSAVQPHRHYIPTPHSYQPRYQHLPAYPFHQPYAEPPTEKAPEFINDKAKGTVASISRPVTVTKPVTTKAKKPLQPRPKKTVPSGKLAFLEQIAPIIHQVNAKVTEERLDLQRLINRLEQGESFTRTEMTWLKDMKRKYRVKGELTAANLDKKLLPKVDIIPVELALAQAANESAWGKSRFAKEAQNLFGVWTYDESKGIVPKKRAKGARHLVRKYDSMEESISHYITLLNSHPAYKPLRDIRLEQRQQGKPLDGIAMAGGLIKYSAKGEQYVAIIRSMISSNNLVEYRQV